jgi:putative selenium metabolism protein SsnA
MLVLKNANAIHFHPSLLRENVDVVIDGGFIIEVGKNAAKKYRASKTIDLANKYISPGIVCSHNHFYSALARGIQARIEPSKDFVGILEHLWWRLDRALDEETLYYSGLVGALEAIKAGTTSVIDHNASPSFIKGSLTTLRKSFEKIGLRGILAYEVTDRNGVAGMKEGVAESIEFCKSIAKSRKKTPHLIESAIGGHAPFTLGDVSLKLIAEAVSATKKGIHIHVAEDQYDATFSRQRYHKELLERLEGFGMLNNKAILVHGVYLGDHDINIINKHDAFLIHNPRSNMNNSVGYMQKLTRVKNVALGTDGIGSNMFEESKLAFFKSSDAKGSLSPNDILKFLHNGNNLLTRYFGYKFGKIEKGYVADIVVYNYNPPTPIVNENVAGHFIYGFSSRDVETVIVNGNIVYENRVFPFDVDGIYKEAQKAARALWKKMDKLN